MCALPNTRQSIADILQAHCKQLASTLQAHCKQVHFDCKPQMAHCWRMCFSRSQASKYPFKYLYYNIKQVQYPSQGCFQMRCPPFGATRLCVLEFYRCLGQGFVGHLGFEVTALDTFGPAFLAFWSLSAISRSNPLLPDSGWCEWYLKLRGFYFYSSAPQG